MIASCRRFDLRSRGLVCGVLFFALGAQLSSARAVTPESPEVQQLIERGLAFLESSDDEVKLGGKCLVAMALAKQGRLPDHPKIVDAVRGCQEALIPQTEVRGRRTGRRREIDSSIYSHAIALVFLTDFDPVKYHSEIDQLTKWLIRRQKPHGGWGYPNRSTGDTSMTQYAVLSAWTTRQAGFDFSDEPIQRVCRWLLRTQDPSGGWGYQGIDPDNYERVAQDEVRESLSAAGLGSMLICASMMGLRDLHSTIDQGPIPSALEPVVVPSGKEDPRRVKEVDPKRIRASIALGRQWFQAHYRIDPPMWKYYYLYALERYMSFLELSGGAGPDDPQWYDDGVKLLTRNQEKNGSWKGREGSGVSTAFSILFLSRSTKQSIERARGLGAGRLAGGRGLPRNLTDVKLRRGKIVTKGLAGSLSELIAVLSDPDHLDHDDLLSYPDPLLEKTDDAIPKEPGQALVRLISTGSPEARIVAVRALSRRRDLDHVPALIHALTDPDWRVVYESSRALRFMSRRFEGFGVTPRENETDRTRAVAGWKDWYQFVRPTQRLQN